MKTSEKLYRLAPWWLQNVLLNAQALRIERHRYGRRYREAVDDLIEAEAWEPRRIREYQDQRLRHIVEKAYRSSSYYREVMEERGLTPDDICTVDDLPKLPVLTKDEVRARGDALMTRDRPGRQWLEGHTSGTTGSPLTLWYDRRTCILTNAVDRRLKIRTGMGADDWIGLLLGRVVVPRSQESAPFWRVNRVHREVWFSSFHLSQENLEHYVEEIRRRDLRYIEGYPSTLYILAQYLVSQGKRLPMEAVISSSETLHQVQRETIEKGFDCPLFDFYAMAERVAWADECEEHAGKHLAETYGYAEIVDEKGRRVPDGEPGYLVGTSLHNEAMPMIRYRMSDVTRIVRESCPCGRTSRRIASVTTKAEDIIVTPDGRAVSPSILTHPFKPLHSVCKSQLVQTDRDRLVVRLVSEDGVERDEEEQLLHSLRERLGEEMRIEVEHHDRLEQEDSGKFRWVISEIEHPYLLSWEGGEGAGG